MAKTKTLLLDLDGTLLGSFQPVLKAAFVLSFTLYFLLRVKNPIPRLKALETIRTQLEEGWAKKKNLSNQAAAFALYADCIKFDEVRAQQELLGATDFCFRVMSWCFYPKKDALEFLSWAQQRYDLILATNPFWPEATVLRRMQRGKIDRSGFRMMTTSENMNFCKPNPFYYWQLLEKAGLQPQDCMMIGNDWRKDSPAKEVGIEVFLLGEHGMEEGLPIQGIRRGNFRELRQYLDGESAKDVAGISKL